MRRNYGVNVVMVQRGMNVMVVPSGDTRIFPGDTIGIIGTDEQIANVLPVIEAEPTETNTTELTDFRLTSVVLTASSPLVGKTLAGADVRRNYQALVVTVERNGEFFDHAPQMELLEGDRLWFVGTSRTASLLH
jgi:CPA2 family monovalent cation:H+ antiporter-2